MPFLFEITGIDSGMSNFRRNHCRPPRLNILFSVVNTDTRMMVLAVNRIQAQMTTGLVSIGQSLIRLWIVTMSMLYQPIIIEEPFVMKAYRVIALATHPSGGFL